MYHVVQHASITLYGLFSPLLFLFFPWVTPSYVPYPVYSYTHVATLLYAWVGSATPHIRTCTSVLVHM